MSNNSSSNSNNRDEDCIDDDLRKYLEKSLNGNPDADEISRSSFRSQQSKQQKEQKQKHQRQEHSFDETETQQQQTNDPFEAQQDDTVNEDDGEEKDEGRDKPFKDDLQLYLDKTPSERQAWLIQRQERMMRSQGQNGSATHAPLTMPSNENADINNENQYQRDLERQGSSFPTTTEESETEEYPTDIELLDQEYPSDVNSMTDHPEHKQTRHPSMEQGDFDVEEDLEVSSYGDFGGSDIEASTHSDNPHRMERQESWLKDVVGKANPSMPFTEKANNHNEQNTDDNNNNYDDKSSMDGTRLHENKKRRRSSHASLLSEPPACWTATTRRLVITGLCIVLSAAIVVVVVALTTGFSSDGSNLDNRASRSEDDDVLPNGNETMISTAAPPVTLPPLTPNCPPDLEDVSILGNPQYNCAWLRRQATPVIAEMCTSYAEISAACPTTCRNCTDTALTGLAPNVAISNAPTNGLTLSPTTAVETGIEEDSSTSPPTDGTGSTEMTQQPTSNPPSTTFLLPTITTEIPTKALSTFSPTTNPTLRRRPTPFN